MVTINEEFVLPLPRLVLMVTINEELPIGHTPYGAEMPHLPQK